MYSTVWFQHGIIGIWRRQAFMETMQAPLGPDVSPHLSRDQMIRLHGLCPSTPTSVVCVSVYIYIYIYIYSKMSSQGRVFDIRI